MTLYVREKSYMHEICHFEIETKWAYRKADENKNNKNKKRPYNV